MYKLIALDLDETLIDSEGHVPEDVSDVLSTVHRNGVHIVIATGRTTKFAKIIAESFCSVYSLIAFNASEIMFEDGSVTETVIPQEIVNEIVDYGHEKGLFLIIFADGMAFTEKEAYQLSSDFELRQLKHIHVDDFKSVGFTNVNKVVAVAEPKFIPEIRKGLEAKFPKLSITQSESYVVEIMREGIDKAYGLKKVCENLGIETKDVVAIGDNYNDISMMKISGCPVAVNNAVPEVKKMAKIVTKAERSQGVKEAVENIFKL